MIEKLNGGPFPDIKFFNMDEIKIAGRKVRALRHGMAGAPGLEIWGPYAKAKKSARRLSKPARSSVCMQVGSRAYATNTLESGWIPSPLPAVYTGDKMKAYRAVAAGDQLRRHGLAGRQLLLQQHRRLLHDALRTGLRTVRQVRSRLHRPRSAREDRGQAAAPQGDVRVERRRCGQGLPLHVRARAEHYKYIDLPLSNYTSASYDKVTNRGKTVGFSMFAGYSYNERSMLSLGVVDPDIAIGNEVTLVWGEEGGGSKKTTVERHKQIEIRAIVSPVPYAKVAREEYAKGWRTGNYAVSQCSWCWPPRFWAGYLRISNSCEACREVGDSQMKTIVLDNYDSFTWNLVQALETAGGSCVVHRSDCVTLAEVERLRRTAS